MIQKFWKNVTNKPDKNKKKYFCGKLCGRCTYFHGCVWLGGAKQLEKLQESFFIWQMLCYFKSETIKNIIVINEHLKNSTSRDFIRSRVTF